MAAQCLERLTNKLFDVLEDDSSSGYALRTFLAGSTVAAGVALLVAAKRCMGDLHVQFWLGRLPETSLAVTMATLAASFVFLVYIRMIRTLRNSEDTKEKHAKRRTTNDAKRWDHACTLSPKLLRSVLFLACLLSGVAAWLSLRTARIGLSVAHDLNENCGASGTSLQVEQTQRRLIDFYTSCQRAPGNRGLIVTQCPGYAAAFPPPSPFVRYIQIMETDLHCNGFCRFGANNLFSAKTSGALVRERCSARLAHRIQVTSLLVGIPGIVVGISITLLSLALLFFQNL